MTDTYKPFDALTPERQAWARKLVEDHNKLEIECGPRPRGSQAGPPLTFKPEHCSFDYRAKHFIGNGTGVAIYTTQNYKFTHEQLRVLKANNRLRP